MNYIGERVKVKNFDGWREEFEMDYSGTQKYIGATGTIENDREFNHRFSIMFDDKELQKIDTNNGRLHFNLENIEFLEKDTYVHTQQTKPPLGVMPKNIFEWHRVIELCRALHEYSLYEDVDLALMIKWADELNDRLYGLKGDKLNRKIEDDDESWDIL